MNLEKYFKKALSYDTYIELLETNRALHELHYKRFSVDEEIIRSDFLNRNYKVLVITEPWCADSLALLPLVRKLCERAPSWEIRVLRRDENPELMDQFLTDNTRSIPVFLFLDENYEMVVKWGARPKSAQKIFDSYKAQIEKGEIKKQDVMKKIRKFYAKDCGKESVAELKSLLESL